MIARLLLLALFAQSAPTLPATCVITNGAYACQTSSGKPVPVDKSWFNHHCRSFDGSRRTDHVYAVCQAWAPDSSVPASRIAKPPKLHLKAIGAAIVVGGILVICALSDGGGCGFLGGR